MRNQFGAGAERRYAYLPESDLRELIHVEGYLDALMVDLVVPGKHRLLSSLSPDERVDLCIRQADFYSGSEVSVWTGVDIEEILAAKCAIFNMGPVEADVWLPVATEARLELPVLRWLREQGFEVYREVPLGRRRIDLLGIRWTSPARKSILETFGVELKNNAKELTRAMDQLNEFGRYCSYTCMAATPRLAVDFLLKPLMRHSPHMFRYDPHALRDRLATVGAGLLLVEDKFVECVHQPHKTRPTTLFRAELMSTLARMRPVAPRRSPSRRRPG